ncbi:MAG: hypothetical protein KBF37_01620 [Saprospiraceae bacterium]|jgi:hypothetical protein|nr:hypothetical protein [Saprospiraceae bacterium]MBP9208993.1 hypothetical protein [Saprospiraceae bacterium]
MIFEKNFLLWPGLYAAMLVIASCGSKAIKSTEMTGIYSVHLELDHDKFNKEHVHDTVAKAMDKAREELSRLKTEVDQKIDTAFIDTSTAQGRMEYFAKSFAKSMAAFGKDLGELGILLGEAAGDVASEAVDFSETLVRQIQLDVELLADGKIVTHSPMARKIQFVGSRWEVSGDQFLMKDDQDKVVRSYQITSQSDRGFELTHDQYRLVFVRKP